MKRFLSMLVAVILLLAMPTMALADQTDIRNSIVRVVEVATDGETYIGTAFAVGKKGEPVRYFVTNRHLASDAVSLFISLGSSQSLIPASLVKYDDLCDLAVFRIDESTDQRKAAVLAPFDVEKLSGSSMHIWAYGFPADSDTIMIDGTGDLMPSYIKDLSVVDGIISRITERTSSEGELIQHTALTSGGNSGGPLVDKNGYVLGVHFANSNQSDFRLAVSVNEVVRLLDSLGIEYTTVSDVRRNMILMIAIIAVAVLAVVAIVVGVLRKKSNPTPKPAPGKFSRTLVCEAGDLAGKSFKLGAKTVIGRDEKRCQILYPKNAKGVSTIHATVEISNNMVRVTDENSSYGTWIDGTKLSPGQPVVMHRGQKLYLGSKKQVLSLHS